MNKTIQHLINAIQFKDIDTIKILLAKQGEFNIQDKNLKSVFRKKRGFLNWFIPILLETKMEGITTDQCIHCRVGATVLIINQGKFPRLVKDDAERSKTGLMIEVKDGEVITIKFCYAFLKTENKYQYECNNDRVLNWD